MTTIYTLLYANAKTLRRSFKKLKETVEGECQIIALDNHYPLITARQKKAIVKQFDIELHDVGENLGLHHGYNYLIKEKGIEKFILFDCDSMPKTKGWNLSMMEVMNFPDIAYCCLENPVSNREMEERGYKFWKQGNHILLQPDVPCIMSITATSKTFVDSMGGLNEPNKYYGGLEAHIWRHFNEQNKFVYIKGVEESRIEGKLKDLSDPDYKAYKWEHAHKGYKGSFDEYLKK